MAVAGHSTHRADTNVDSGILELFDQAGGIRFAVVIRVQNLRMKGR